PLRSRSTCARYALTVLSRHPQHVACALLVRPAARHEQEVRQAIDVFERLRRDALVGSVVELDHDALGAPAHRAGGMKVGGGRGPARQDEGFERLELGVEPIDLPLEPGHLRLGHVEPGAGRAFALSRQAKIGLHVEQIVLDAAEQGIEVGVAGRVQAGHPDDRIHLVQGAVGGDPQVVLLAPLAGSQRRRAVVAGAGVDAVEDDHVRRGGSSFRISRKRLSYPTAIWNPERHPMRLMLAVAFAALLLIPAGGPVVAGDAPALVAARAGALALSSARKKKAKKAPKKEKEQYLRAVPSPPPAGAR